MPPKQILCDYSRKASNDMKAVILAGGLGTRLQPYTFLIPKPMLPLADKPLLEHIVSWLKSHNIIDIMICTSYLGKTIQDYFGDGSRFGISIKYSRTERPLGTAGQLKSAEKFLDDTFVCLYGNSIYEFDLQKVIKQHRLRKAMATMTLMNHSERLGYGFIDVDSRGKVLSWNEKPEFRGLINTGCYVMEPGFLKYIPRDSAIGMVAAFMKYLKAGDSVYSCVINAGFIDIGNKRSYLNAYKQYLARLGRV